VNVQSDFSVEMHPDDGAVVLAVSGELDLASSPALEDALEIVYESECSLVVMDLRALEFMDSTGLSVLVKAQQRSQEAGRRFGLVKGGPQVQRLLSLTGIDQRMTVADSPEELLGRR
jgi:anti-sigma B factor antagonist